MILVKFVSIVNINIYVIGRAPSTSYYTTSIGDSLPW